MNHFLNFKTKKKVDEQTRNNALFDRQNNRFQKKQYGKWGVPAETETPIDRAKTTDYESLLKLRNALQKQLNFKITLCTRIQVPNSVQKNCKYCLKFVKIDR